MSDKTQDWAEELRAMLAALTDMEDTQEDGHFGTLADRIFRIDQRALQWEAEAARLRQDLRDLRSHILKDGAAVVPGGTIKFISHYGPEPQVIGEEALPLDDKEVPVLRDADSIQVTWVPGWRVVGIIARIEASLVSSKYSPTSPAPTRTETLVKEILDD